MSQEESRELYKKNPINYIQIKSTKSAKMRSIHIRIKSDQIRIKFIKMKSNQIIRNERWKGGIINIINKNGQKSISLDK